MRNLIQPCCVHSAYQHQQKALSEELSMDINYTKPNQNLATEQNHSSAVFKMLFLLTLFLFVYFHPLSQ